MSPHLQNWMILAAQFTPKQLTLSVDTYNVDVIIVLCNMCMYDHIIQNTGSICIIYINIYGYVGQLMCML